MFVVRVDAVITDIIDSLEPMIRKLPNNDGKIIDGVSRIEITGSSDEIKFTKLKVSKCETIWQESAERVCSLLQAAALQFLEHGMNCFTAKIDTKYSSLLKESQFSEEKSECYSLNNGSRQYTLSFTYPENGHHYIALTLEAFSRFVCFLIGTVKACYTLHFSSFECRSKSFAADDALSFQRDSDDDQSVSPSDSPKVLH